MNKPSTKSILRNEVAKGALLAISIQLILGTTGVAASGEQTLMNTSLPLPDASTLTVQRSAKTATQQKSISGIEGATPVAVRFFGNSAAATPTTAQATQPTPASTAAAAGSAASLRPAMQMPAGEENLETNASWFEEEQAAAAKAAATQQSVSNPSTANTAVDASSAAPNTVTEASPVLREAVPTGATETATAPVASTTPDPIATSAATTAAAPVEKAEVSANEVIPEAALKLTSPIQEKPGLALLPSTPARAADIFEKAPIIIDNDEAVEQQATLEYEEMPLDDETKTKVKAGAHFPIVITSEITSRTAKTGDPVQGRLKFDLKIGDRLVAVKGSTVRGHLNYALKARTPLAAMVSTNRWYKNSGCLGIQFDEIINERGEHIPLVAEPAKSALYVKNKAEGRVLGINHKGQIAGPWSQQLQYKAVRVGMNFAMAPLGAMTFGAMPVALGVMGAVNPSFAFMKPVGLNVRHRRLKGFAWGFLSGVPGSWLIEDTTVKGQEAVIKPGDEFLAELRQEFTGEPATEAEMLGGADGKVHGEVVGAKNNKIFTRGKKKASKQASPNM